MGTPPIAPEDLVAIVDRAVLPAGREVDLPVHRFRRYVVIEGEVLVMGTNERCGPGTVLEPVLGRLVLRTLAGAVLGVVDGVRR